MRIFPTSSKYNTYKKRNLTGLATYPSLEWSLWSEAKLFITGSSWDPVWILEVWVCDLSSEGGGDGWLKLACESNSFKILSQWKSYQLAHDRSAAMLCCCCFLIHHIIVKYICYNYGSFWLKLNQTMFWRNITYTVDPCTTWELGTLY